MTRLGMKSVPSFINEYESNLYLSITKKNKHHLLMYCSLYRRGLTLTLESFLLCIKIPIKKCPATITEALNAAYTLVRGGGGKRERERERERGREREKERVGWASREVHGKSTSTSHFS